MFTIPSIATFAEMSTSLSTFNFVLSERVIPSTLIVRDFSCSVVVVENSQSSSTSEMTRFTLVPVVQGSREFTAIVFRRMRDETNRLCMVNSTAISGSNYKFKSLPGL